MANAPHCVALDPCTHSAGDGFPEGSRVKTLPPLRSMPALWGTVAKNDGTRFTVAWDLGGTSEHLMDEEWPRVAAALRELLVTFIVPKPERLPHPDGQWRA